MTARTVTEDIDLPSGADPTKVIVEFYLAGVSGTRISNATVISTGNTLVNKPFKATVSASGSWTTTLQPNSNISPAGTVWARTIYMPGVRPSRTYAIVPDTSGTHVWGSILAEAPTTIASAPLQNLIANLPVMATGLDYTGASNMTAELQAILDAASTAQASIDHSMFGTVSLATVEVHLLPGKVKVSGLTIPNHVRVVGNGTVFVAASSGYVISDTGVFSGIDNIGFLGGGVGVGAAGISTLGDHLEIRRCRFQNFAGRAMLLGGEAHTVSETFAQSCLLDTRSLAAKTGILEVTGNAIRVTGNNEFAGGLSALTSSSAYKCAVVATGTLNVFDGVYAETADVGFYVNGNNQVFTGCVSDINAGHGWEFGGGGGQLIGCVSRWNSQDSGGTYDGFHVTDGTYIFDACQSYSPGPATGRTQHAYGFNDVSSHNPYASAFGPSCVSVGHATASFATHSGVTGASVTRPQHPWVAVSTGTTTPSIDGLSAIKLHSSGAQNITNFTNGVDGQRLIVWGDGQSTLKVSGSFVTRAGTDLLCASNVPYEFILGNGTWRQIG